MPSHYFSALTYMKCDIVNTICPDNVLLILWTETMSFTFIDPTPSSKSSRNTA